MLSTYLVYFDLDRSIEQLARSARVPFSIFLGKFETREMSNNARHSHRTLTPWWAEVEVKFVVLNEAIATNAMLSKD